MITRLIIFYLKPFFISGIGMGHSDVIDKSVDDEGIFRNVPKLKQKGCKKQYYDGNQYQLSTTLEFDMIQFQVAHQ